MGSGMNREDITRMAREAGLLPNYEIYEDDLERFAALVAAAAKAEEREACAKVCEDAPEPDGRDLAERIRARSNT